MEDVLEQAQSLSQTEQQRLTEYEQTIEEGLTTFIKVGEALMAIRQSKLYRKDYRNFEDYCQKRWGMVVQQARRLMRACQTVQHLQELQKQNPWVLLPESERQIRALTRLSPQDQQQLWQNLMVNDTLPTGKQVEAEVNDFLQQQNQEGDVTNEREGTSHTSSLSPEISEPTSTPSFIHFSSASHEWYTPKTILDATLAILGNIDLDPCSNSLTNPNVPASQHFTLAEDGLVQDWTGRVYLNPPYGQQIKQWVEKLHQHYQQADISQAIALLPARTDTEWFRLLRDYPRCFIKGRLTFSDQPHPAPFPSVVFYLGKNETAFHQAFQSLGDIFYLAK